MLHQAWLRVLSASSPQAGLREPPLQGPRHLEPKAYGEAGCGLETPLQGKAECRVDMPTLCEGECEVNALLQKGECKPEPLLQGKCDMLPQRGPTSCGCGPNVLPLKGKHMLEVLHQEDECKLDTVLLGSPNEGKCGHACKALPQLDQAQVKPTTLGSRRRPAGQHIFKSKRLIGANKSNAAGIHATNKKNIAPLEQISQAAPVTETTTHLGQYPLLSHPAVEEPNTSSC